MDELIFQCMFVGLMTQILLFNNFVVFAV